MNTQITEDYVSYETAKLLKEKEFYTPYCYSYYFPELKSKTPSISNRVIPKDADKYLAPTLQMAMKWLREVHNIFIEISVDEMLKDEGYQWALYNNSTKEIRPYSGWEHSYEQACEAAIKYCLTDLIK